MTPARRAELDVKFQKEVWMWWVASQNLYASDPLRPSSKEYLQKLFVEIIEQVEREVLDRVKAEVQAYPCLYCSVLSNHPEQPLVEWLDQQRQGR
jgi:hypothetical protein